MITEYKQLLKEEDIRLQVEVASTSNQLYINKIN